MTSADAPRGGDHGLDGLDWSKAETLTVPAIVFDWLTNDEYDDLDLFAYEQFVTDSEWRLVFFRGLATLAGHNASRPEASDA